MQDKKRGGGKEIEEGSRGIQQYHLSTLVVVCI